MARVLIVDDNDDFRALLRTALELEGFEVAAAANGTDALHSMRQAPADIVVTDLFMPDKDGLETILEIRQRHPQAKIVAMSGWQSVRGVDYLSVAREIGAVHVVRKPFDLDELLGVLRRHS